VALLLRSAEIQPAFGRFSDWTQNPITPPTPHTTPHTQRRPAARGRRIQWDPDFVRISLSTSVEGTAIAHQGRGARVSRCS